MFQCVRPYLQIQKFQFISTVRESNGSSGMGVEKSCISELFGFYSWDTTISTLLFLVSRPNHDIFGNSGVFLPGNETSKYFFTPSPGDAWNRICNYEYSLNSDWGLQEEAYANDNYYDGEGWLSCKE